jgi:uncharacterized protein (TIGR00251 family)
VNRPETTLPPYVEAIEPGVWRVRLWIQPGAKKSELAGLYQERLKVKLAAPPVDGKANKALLAYLADILNIKKNEIELAAGETSRQKTIVVHSATQPKWAAILNA